MDEQYVTHIVFQQCRTSSSYSERETAVACHLSIGALRHLHALGLIEGKRLVANCAMARKRSYSYDGSAACNATWASTWRESK